MSMKANQIMRNFLVRDASLGFNFAEAIREVERLETCETERDYFRVKRVGSTVPLTRSLRRSIWMLWENAQEHAGFGEWLKEQKA